MPAPKFRSSGDVVLPAIAGAAVLAVASTLASAPVLGVKTVIADAVLLADEGWIMGGTTEPDPSQSYLNDVEQLYLNSQLPGYSFTGLHTPEEFCPVVCFPAPGDDPTSWSTMNFGVSLNTGAEILNQQIQPALAANPNADLAVFGYSQSATIATQEMNDLIAGGQTDPNLHVVLIGDPNNPIGGILDRFRFPDGIQAFSLTPEPQHLPFLDVPLNMAPTPTSSFPTDIYTGEYDGWADFPRDPINVLADINALIGIDTVHPYYPDPTPGVNLNTNNIIDLGTIGDTHFYDIPAPLPMLAFMYDGGPAGRFFYDAFNPWLSLIDNWAYGNPGDPGAGITIDGVNPIGHAGPWQVDATGQLVASGVAGLFEKMDPLQMLAGEEYATVQSFVGPIDALLQDAGQSPIPQSVVNLLLSGYTITNEVDQLLLTGWNDVANELGLASVLGPDAIFNGAPLIPGQPLIDLVGFGFDIFNFFGA